MTLDNCADKLVDRLKSMQIPYGFRCKEDVEKRKRTQAGF